MQDEGALSRAHSDPVASYRHFLGFLGIVVVVAVAGYGVQNRQVAGGGLVETHANVIPMYLSVTFMNWLLVLYAWKGIRRQGGSFSAVIAGRWTSLREVLVDLGIAACFWGVMLAASWGLDAIFAHGNEKSLDILLPRTGLEISVWIATAVSAGFCEEFVFRGYAQRQVRSLIGNDLAAVVGQALVFGFMHSYQGWRPVISVIVIGVLFGTLAYWRKSLRVGMVAHAWQDVWAGWLRFVVL